MITDGLGYRNRMVEDEFAITVIIPPFPPITLKNIRKLFMCIRKTHFFDSLDKITIFFSKNRKYNT